MKIQKKLTQLLLSVTACALFLTGCSGKSIELALTIDDSEFTFQSTVQDLYDAGFVLCDTGYGKIIADEDLPELPARTVDTVSSYYVGRPSSDTMADYTGIKIQVYNDSSKDCSIKECDIFHYTYEREINSTAEDNGITVLFNGVDFSDCDYKQGVTAMEDMGIVFDEKDKTEFLDENTNGGYGWSLSTSSGSYTYSLSRDASYDDNGNKALVIDEVEFKKKLNIDYSK